MADIRVNGVRLYYEEHGAATPILCIHGTGSSCALWREAAGPLAAHGRTILYDRSGFGRSERPEPFVTDVHRQADEAAALLDALGATPAVVIGRSHGGEIAVDLALRYPGHVRALALLEGGGLSLVPALGPWLEQVHAALFAVAETEPERVGETFIGHVLGEGAWEALPPAVRRIVADNGPAIVAEERGGLLDVTREQLATIEQPTLVVVAADSPPALADVGEIVAGAIPRARLERVAGDHLIDPAHPAVLGFLADVLAGAAAGRA